MKHNFSRELACFNVAQEIFETAIVFDHLTENVAEMKISNSKITSAFIKFIGREPTGDELLAIVQALIENAPFLAQDCSTFAFAHDLFHIVGD